MLVSLPHHQSVIGALVFIQSCFDVVVIVVVVVVLVVLFCLFC